MRRARIETYRMDIACCFRTESSEFRNKARCASNSLRCFCDVRGWVSSTYCNCRKHSLCASFIDQHTPHPAYSSCITIRASTSVALQVTKDLLLCRSLDEYIPTPNVGLLFRLLEVHWIKEYSPPVVTVSSKKRVVPLSSRPTYRPQMLLAPPVCVTLPYCECCSPAAGQDEPFS